MSDSAEASPAPQSNGTSPAEAPSTPKRHNTQQRLFGQVDEVPKLSPKKMNPTYHSTIFSEEIPTPQRTPKRTIPALARNPITGEVKPAAPVQQQVMA